MCGVDVVLVQSVVGCVSAEAEWVYACGRVVVRRWGLLVFFFFNDPATTEIYTLSLHDALPIYLLYLQLVKCLVSIFHQSQPLDIRSHPSYLQ